MAERLHEYAARLTWTGNTNGGTASYTSYGRGYRVQIAGKPDLVGTADPAFRGEAGMHNPEDLFLTSIAACHMLSYFSLCARAGVRVLAYEDEAQGRMVLDTKGGGMFEDVCLHPRVTIEAEEYAELAVGLHATAHELCFIANSCSVPIRHLPVVQTDPRRTTP